MATISQFINGESGSAIRNKISEALKSVEVDSTIEGDGTLSTPLSIQNSLNTKLNSSAIDKFGDIYLSSSQTVSVSSQNTFYPIAGSNWISDISHNFSSNTSGQLICDSVTPNFYLVIASISASTENILLRENIRVKIYNNGNEIVKSEIVMNVSTEPSNTFCFSILNLAQTDNIELRVANASSTSNITVLNANLSAFYLF